MKISIYKNVSDTVGSTGNLIQFLTTDKWKKLSDAVRNEKDKDKRTELKKSLPCATLSGIFKGRGKKNLLTHSGFIAIDIDADDNPEITDWKDFVSQLGNLDEVYFAGRSVSGKGAYCLMRIEHPEHHEDHFKAILQDFKAIGVNIDPACKDVSRLRFYSYNKEYYLNENSKTYTKIHEAPKHKAPRVTNQTHNGHSNYSNSSDVSRLVDKLVRTNTNIVSGYNNWFNVGASLSNINGGREFFHKLSMIDGSNYNPEECDKQFDNIKAGGGISVSTLFHIAKQHGIEIHSTRTKRRDKQKTKIIYNHKPSDQESKSEIKEVEGTNKTTSNDDIEASTAKQTNIETNSASTARVKQPLTTSSDRTDAIVRRKNQKAKMRYNGTSWTDRIDVVEEFFQQKPLRGVIKINSYTTILDAEKYINSGISYAKANNGNPTFEIYLIRIEELMNSYK